MLQLVGGGDAPVAANERRADQSVIFRSPISLTSRCELTELLVLPFAFGAPSAVAAPSYHSPREEREEARKGKE